MYYVFAQSPVHTPLQTSFTIGNCRRQKEKNDIQTEDGLVLPHLMHSYRIYRTRGMARSVVDLDGLLQIVVSRPLGSFVDVFYAKPGLTGQRC